MHEIGHVLGMSSDSLQYFRHPVSGAPLTRRPFELSDVTCVDGSSRTYFGLPGPDVLREGKNAVTGNRYYEVVTPTVRRVVRNHFDCPTMTGARLENQQGTTDCFGSHWDEMLYYTEIMGAVFSQSANVLSPLTLAYLEDSGWYRANYESPFVQISMFGHGAGCGFVDGNCIDPSNGEVPHPEDLLRSREYERTDSHRKSGDVARIPAGFVPVLRGPAGIAAGSAYDRGLLPRTPP